MTEQEMKVLASALAPTQSALALAICLAVRAIKRQPGFDTKGFDAEIRRMLMLF